MINQFKTKSRSVKRALTFALIAATLSACNTNNLEVSPPASPGNVTTEEVADNTNTLLGRTVTVRSEPMKKISANTFTIRDEKIFGSEPILVVNASGKPIVLPAGDTEVQVTGQVAALVVADIEREYNLGLQPEVYVEYEGKPAIIAQSIALAPKPGEITTNPRQYYNKVIAVPAEVEEIISPNAFTLDEDKLIGGRDLLVLIANPKQSIRYGEKVVTTSVLRPFVVADIEQDYDLTWDLDLQKKLEVEYRNKPVLIAQSVYPVPAEAK